MTQWDVIEYIKYACFDPHSGGVVLHGAWKDEK